MRLTIQAQAMTEAMNMLVKFSAVRPTLAVLANIEIEATPTQVILRTTNLEAALEIAFNAKVSEPGMLTVNARDFLAAIKSYKKGEVRLADRNPFQLVINGGECVLLGIDPAEFPPMVWHFDRADTRRLWSRDLVRAIDVTAVAASTDEARPVLEAIQIGFPREDPDGDNAIFAGADGFRIHEYAIRQYVSPDKWGLEGLLPAKDLLKLARFLDKQTCPVELSFQWKAAQHENQLDQLNGVEFRWDYQSKQLEGACRLLLRPIEGQFPPYRQVFPQPKDKVILTRIDTAAFIAALEGILPVAKAGVNIVYGAVHADSLLLEAHGVEAGQAMRLVPATSWTTDFETGVLNEMDGAFYFAFNPKFLQEAAKAVKSTHLVMHIFQQVSLNSDRRVVNYPMPVLMEAYPPDHLQMVIMPMHMIDEMFPAQLLTDKAVTDSIAQSNARFSPPPAPYQAYKVY